MSRPIALRLFYLGLLFAGHLSIDLTSLKGADPPNPANGQRTDRSSQPPNKSAASRSTAPSVPADAAFDTNSPIPPEHRDLLLPPGFSPTASRGQSDPRLEQMIRDAIDGKQTPGESGMSVQMLDLLRRQSILRGSVLDEDPDDVTLGPAISNRSKTDEDGCIDNEKHENQLRAAELLLRAARQLTKIDSLNPVQDDLVKRMRHHAAQLIDASLGPAPEGQSSKRAVLSYDEEDLPPTDSAQIPSDFAAPPQSGASGNPNIPPSNPPPAGTSNRP